MWFIELVNVVRALFYIPYYSAQYALSTFGYLGDVAVYVAARAWAWLVYGANRLRAISGWAYAQLVQLWNTWILPGGEKTSQALSMLQTFLRPVFEVIYSALFSLVGGCLGAAFGVLWGGVVLTDYMRVILQAVRPRALAWANRLDDVLYELRTQAYDAFKALVDRANLLTGWINAAFTPALLVRRPTWLASVGVHGRRTVDILVSLGTLADPAPRWGELREQYPPPAAAPTLAAPWATSAAQAAAIARAYSIFAQGRSSEG